MSRTTLRSQVLGRKRRSPPRDYSPSLEGRGSGLGVRLPGIQIENSLDNRRHSRSRACLSDQLTARRYHLEERIAARNEGIERARVAVAQTFFGGGIDHHLRKTDESVAKRNPTERRRARVQRCEDVG